MVIGVLSGDAYGRSSYPKKPGYEFLMFPEAQTAVDNVFKAWLPRLLESHSLKAVSFYLYGLGCNPEGEVTPKETLTKVLSSRKGLGRRTTNELS